MALLKPADIRALRGRFARDLVDPVTITLFTSSPGGLTVPGVDCRYCGAAQQLLEEVAALDPRLTLVVRSMVTEPDAARAADVERIPAILVGRNGDARIRYYGIPAGFEFGVLVDGLVAASRTDGGLSPQTRQALGALAKDVHLQVFVTPTCPYCPRAAHLAYAMAAASPRVRADVVEANEFPALAERYEVYGVPKVVINDVVSFEGAVPEPAFLSYVLQAVGPDPDGGYVEHPTHPRVEPPE
ncbi:MAG: thioredoxin family protein [Armatimonadota bacterium]|nr:thioredoxin family protein [Armatimonadota bacterium]